MTESSGGLAGRAGLVTGAASGIGAAITDRLLAASARILAVDIDTAALAQLGATHASLATEPADVTHYSELEGAAASCRRIHGSLDFLVANAGVVDHGSLLDGDPDRWRRVLETNVLGVAYSVRAVLPGMAAAGGGHIVIVASLSGRIVYEGEPLYMASKWAAVGLGRTLRLEAGRLGVRVSVIEPGLVDTPMIRATPEGLRMLAEGEALAPADVARAVHFCLEQPASVNVTELVLQPTSELV